MMRTMTVSELRTHAFEVLRLIEKTREPVLITKRGKPLVELVPFRGSDEAPVLGRLAHTLVFEGDIVSPLGEEIWDACKEKDTLV